MGKAGVMKWDPERERKLWLSIIQEMAPSMSQINWENVRDRLGYEDCTAAACKKKLENTKTKLGMWGGAGTPSKGGQSPAKGKAPGSGKKRKSQAIEPAEDDDAEEPERKACKATQGDEDEDEKPKATKVKDEAGSDDENGFF